MYFNPGDTPSAGSLRPVLSTRPAVGHALATGAATGRWAQAGISTGSKIDDRIAFTPCHNSVMSWAGARPEPIQSATLNSLDTLGRSRPLLVRRWAWLIGMTDDTDAQLRDRAKSFATPPDLDLVGARLDFAGYVIERRAMRLEATAREVKITIKPKNPCVNPVFEFTRSPSRGDQGEHRRESGSIPNSSPGTVVTSLGLDHRTISTPATLQIVFDVMARRQP